LVAERFPPSPLTPPMRGRRSCASNLLGLAVVGAVLFVLGVLGRRDSKARPLVELQPDATWTGDIAFEDEARLDFELAVPADAVLVRVQLACEHAELDLYAQAGSPIDDVESAYYAVTEPGDPRELVLDWLGPDRLAGTTWYFTALWPYATPPRAGGQRIERAKATVEVSTMATRVDGELVAGQPQHSELDEPSGGFRTFHVTVPEDARALRIDLFDVSSNLDLYARAGKPILAADDDVALAENGWGHETLLIERDSRPPLVPGEWYIDVVDAVGPTRTLPFSILVEFDAGVPGLLRSLPVIPRPAGDGMLTRALLAVVELATEDSIGSGTILTPDGWILTNEHVVGNDPRAEIVVSLSLDPTLPPEESFRAKLVRVDDERDLALVKIVSGLYGQEIPRDYALPTLALGDPAEMHVGEAMWLVGYPATGGTGSRVTISATRGILAGFERADFGVLLKTDAEITDGNSGGAALDERGLLIGVPSATVENGSGQIGYVHPITALPRAWVELMH
jgi:S1-C subfamily serine protease